MYHQHLTSTNSTYSHVDDAKQPPELSLPPKRYCVALNSNAVQILDNTLSYYKQISPRVASSYEPTAAHHASYTSCIYKLCSCFHVPSLNNFHHIFHKTSSIKKSQRIFNKYQVRSATEGDIFAWLH